ncbi:hypothetical protein EDD86DRAFT_193086 [Gorgonomyces haynaldii]|nr:hypothetical protein EDD86DRAFT_193086 [Gorgonomyces haynaldii]
MRTLYFGNLPQSITFETLLNHVKGGVIEHVKLFLERNCAFITFMDASTAAQVFAESQVRRFMILGSEVRVGWGKASAAPAHIVTAVQQGVSRNVFVGHLDGDLLVESYLQSQMEVFGALDCVKILHDKRIGFVHFTSIANAMKAVATLSIDPKWHHRRLFYGRDRCAVVRTLSNPNLRLPPTPEPEKVNRTIYLGGIAQDAVTKDLCDAIRGGILQNIRYFRDKNIAFVTFIDQNNAQEFYTRTTEEGLVIKGKRVKIGWGKPQPAPTHLLDFVQNGASRNVYIGGIDENVSEESLHEDFKTFGDIELVNIVPEKNIGFVNFVDISYAIRAVDVMKTHPKYIQFKVNYGKDRCGNPPRRREKVPDMILQEHEQ